MNNKELTNSRFGRWGWSMIIYTALLYYFWSGIPGLYCVGTDACNIFGDSYPFILSGNTVGFCLNSGRIAGENAAAELEDDFDF